MGGPIVRTGATPKFWSNWDKVFGDSKKSKGAKTATAVKAKSAKKSAKKAGKSKKK